ncbi:MAG: ankyrin repeat domain-containing protein [Nitrospira sp.]|nr:ankyrin repeat domain-containing protein [Nitrospira sp.]
MNNESNAMEPKRVMQLDKTALQAFYAAARAFGLIDPDKAFVDAADKGRSDVVQAFLDAGAAEDVTRDVLGKALVAASAKDSANAVKALLNAGADVHYSDDSALWQAASAGALEAARVLLNNDADPDNPANYNYMCQADEARSPLCEAALKGHDHMAKLLLDRGANVHAGNDLPLYIATVYSRPKVIQVLLKNGANLHSQGLVGSGENELVYLARGRNKNDSHWYHVSYMRSDATQEEVADALDILETAAKISMNDPCP